MELCIFIVGLFVCALTTGVLIYFKMNKNSFGNVVAKIIASACFVVFAVLLSSLKTNTAYYGSYAISLLIIGLVCGLVGDILLEFKGVYPFHEKRFFNSGFTTLIIGHICFLISLFLFAGNDLDLTSSNYIIHSLLLLVAAVAIAIAIHLALSKGLKFDFKGDSILSCVYALILLYAAFMGVYFCFMETSFMLFILVIGLCLYVFSYYALLAFYYSQNPKTSGLMVTYTVAYYMAQIIVAGFIYFA